MLLRGSMMLSCFGFLSLSVCVISRMLLCGMGWASLCVATDERDGHLSCVNDVGTELSAREALI